MPPTAKLNKQNTFDPAQARTMLAPAVAAFSPPKKKLQEKLKPELYDAYALEEGADDTSAVLQAAALLASGGRKKGLARMALGEKGGARVSSPSKRSQLTTGQERDNFLQREHEQRARGDRFWGFELAAEWEAKERALLAKEDKLSNRDRRHDNTLRSFARSEQDHVAKVRSTMGQRAMREDAARAEYALAFDALGSSEPVGEYAWPTRQRIAELAFPDRALFDVHYDPAKFALAGNLLAPPAGAGPNLSAAARAVSHARAQSSARRELRRMPDAYAAEHVTKARRGAYEAKADHRQADAIWPAVFHRPAATAELADFVMGRESLVGREMTAPPLSPQRVVLAPLDASSTPPLADDVAPGEAGGGAEEETDEAAVDALARDVFRTLWLETRGAPPPSGVPQRMRGAELLAGLDAGNLAIFEPKSRALRILKSAEYLRDALVRLENEGAASREGLAEGEWAEFLLMVDDLAFMNGMAS